MIVSNGDGGNIVLGSPLVDELPPLPAHGEIRPLTELRTWGVLWLLNRVAFYPRGYALCLAVDDDGDVNGWALLGDGRERLPVPSAAGDELFGRVLKLLEPRPSPDPI